MAIDPKTAYWTGALGNMDVILSLLFSGLRAIRSGRVQRHLRLMISAVALVGLFLLSYPAKLAFLGREQLELWSRLHVWVLRFHELCVFCLVVGGGFAVYRALSLGLRTLEAPLREIDTRGHRRAGWTAIVGGSLGILSAAYILHGMYTR